MKASTAKRGLKPFIGRINLDDYDRRSRLTPDEVITVRKWWHSNVAITHRQAPRLREPVADALLHDGRDKCNRLRAVKYLLRQVGKREQSYWGWDETTWLEIVDQSPVLNQVGMVPQLVATAFLLCGFKSLEKIQRNLATAVVARLVFGDEVINTESDRLMSSLNRVGFSCVSQQSFMPSVMAAVALKGGDPRLESFDKPLLEYTKKCYEGTHLGNRISRLANGLSALGILRDPIRFRVYEARHGTELDEINPEWMTWCRRWLETTTLREGTRQANYNALLRVGIWLGRTHPDVISPEDWSVEICADFLAAVDKMHVGDWAGSKFDYRLLPTKGQPMRPQSKVAMYQVMRRFLADIASWEWARLRCNPRYHLSTPRSVLRLVGVNPRTIDDAMWHKLNWASLNLEEKDLPAGGYYPLALLQAMAVIWTHAGLRSNEIVRLRLGCARPQFDEILDQSGVAIPSGKLCWLDIPPSKTATAYSKPVSAAVYKYAEVWSDQRPTQDSVLDRRTGEKVQNLFQIRNRKIEKRVLNLTVIPMLCRKAGIPLEDSRGRITSHRGRASAVTMLANVPQGMTVFELAKWCGHKSVQSTMSYIQSKPTQLASAFVKADQIARMIEVVLDKEAIAEGVTKNGAPWKYYDLGDSYCSNAFWSTCPHRMACARCFFNVPKQSAKGLVIDAQKSAQRLLEEVWLSPDERAAVTGDVEALNEMLSKLKDKPALDGRTPIEITVVEGPKTIGGEGS